MLVERTGANSVRVRTEILPHFVVLALPDLSERISADVLSVYLQRPLTNQTLHALESDLVRFLAEAFDMPALVPVLLTCGDKLPSQVHTIAGINDPRHDVGNPV